MSETVRVNGKDVPIIKATRVETTIKNKKTGEIYKDEQEWRSKNIPENEVQTDVIVHAPGLDLFPKTK
tara:strand:- start:135 stop:338 length:204 start_codon:yes stop_codon:yes gene_type:complete